MVAASMGGLLHVTGDPAGPPTKVNVNGINNNVNILDPNKGGRGHDGPSNSIVCTRCNPRCSSSEKGHWEGSVDPVQPIGHPGAWMGVTGGTRIPPR